MSAYYLISELHITHFNRDVQVWVFGEEESEQAEGEKEYSKKVVNTILLFLDFFGGQVTVEIELQNIGQV